MMKTLKDWYFGKRFMIRYNLQSWTVGFHIGVYFWIEVFVIKFYFDFSKNPEEDKDDALYLFRQIADRFKLNISSAEKKLQKYEKEIAEAH
jgi:hypothetical protein